MTLRYSLVALLGALFALTAGPALARCSMNMVELDRPMVQVAALDGFRLAEAKSISRALVTFVGHATFQIDTPQGVRVLTDYNGLNGFGRKPDIVTMNNTHSTHYTDDPEEGITHVLRGWPHLPGTSEAKHQVVLKDLKVWNVPTNARSWAGETVRINGNSIFIYAINDLCIAHVGHLHHRLTKEHLEELGRIDVLMIPIDGSFTMGQPLMVDVVRQLQPKIVLPMHYWGRAQLDRFMSQMETLEHDFIRPDSLSMEIVREQLPEKITVIAIAGDGGG